MKIEKDKVVLFHYSLQEQGANELKNTHIENNHKELPMAYLHGHKNILPALEDALQHKCKGDKLSVTLTPEQAYGPIKPNCTRRVPVKHLASKHKRLRTGVLVKLNTEDGVIDGRVLKAGKFMVDLDLNHPLAGKDRKSVV